MRDTFNQTAKRVAVLNLNRAKRVLRNVSHIAGAFVKAAKLPTIAHRTPHLPRKLWHDVVVHRAYSGNTRLHQLYTIRQRKRSPVGLRVFRADNCRMSLSR